MPSKKVLKAKQKIVSDLAEKFKQAQVLVFADYRGLTVAEDTQMRTEMRNAGVTYKVIKNSLSLRALEDAGYSDVAQFLSGPTAVAYSNDDVIAPAKIIKQHADKHDELQIKGGIFEGRAISSEEVNKLASIPAQEVLYGQLVFGLISPVASLAMLLNAVREKAEEAGAGSIGEVVNAAVKAEQPEAAQSEEA